MNAKHAQRMISNGLSYLTEETKVKLDLIQAEETHGEKLNENALAEDLRRLEEMDAIFSNLDLSYIE